MNSPTPVAGFAATAVKTMPRRAFPFGPTDHKLATHATWLESASETDLTDALALLTNERLEQLAIYADSTIELRSFLRHRALLCGARCTFCVTEGQR